MRKKRCYHDETPVTEPSRTEGNTRESTVSPAGEGPYHPQSVLVDLSQSEPVSNVVRHLESAPGASPRLSNLPPTTQDTNTARAKRQLAWYILQTKGAAAQRLSESHRRYLEEAGALTCLPRTTTDALVPIYVSLLDDLLPIVDGAKILREYSNGQSSPYLVKTICLVASKYRQAAPFLRIGDNEPILGALEFSRRLLRGLDVAIKANLEPNRVTKIQMLMLMHLHNDGLGGLDRSSAYLSQAICEAWALSLHHHIPGRPDQEKTNMLWWTLRNLDRLNKVIMGAAPFVSVHPSVGSDQLPVYFPSYVNLHPGSSSYTRQMVDDTDIEIDRAAPGNDSIRSQLMLMSLVLGDLMATATKVYKASLKTRVDDCHTFPSFSEIASGIALDDFHHSHKNYFEIWYHLAAMMSCRYSGPGTSLYERRLHSAECILKTLSQGGHASLPPLPLVPYAISMSTTIIYRAFRDGQRDLNAASHDLSLCYETLEALSQSWTTVRGVAKLTRRILRVLKGPASSNTRAQDQGSCMLQVPHPETEVSCANWSPSCMEPWKPGRIELEEALALRMNRSNRTSQPSYGGQTPLEVNQDSLEQLHDAYPMEFGTSLSQLDNALGDMFDYTVPNVLRDPSTWGFLGMGASDDEGLFDNHLPTRYLAGTGQDIDGYDLNTANRSAHEAWTMET